MDKDALDPAKRRCDCAGSLIETNAHEDHCAVYWPERLLDETREVLGANGYVVVPRHLLDELLDAADREVDFYNGSRRLHVAAAAVVEAVGPTREDTK